MDLRGFDANTIEPRAEFELLPACEVVAAITESESKSTKKGDGSFMAMTITILEGQHKGRKLWDRLNLRNPSKAAVEIAQATLSSICRAVGIMQPKDSQELHNIPMLVKVGLQKNKETGEMSNVIKGYDRRGAAGNKPATSAADASTPPWKR